MSLRRTVFALASAGCLWALCLAGYAVAQESSQSDAPKMIRKTAGVLEGSAIKRVEPVYPPLAKAARVTGSVVVELTIDEDGDVTAAHAVSGHPLLKDSAVAAARAWKFSPTELSGQRVKVNGTLTFNF